MTEEDAMVVINRFIVEGRGLIRKDETWTYVLLNNETYGMIGGLVHKYWNTETKKMIGIHSNLQISTVLEYFKAQGPWDPIKW